MKVITITVLISVFACVYGHPDEIIFHLLCKASPNAANAMRACMTFEPKDYQDMFEQCRIQNNAETDEALCDKWDEVFECAHENYDHDIIEYPVVEKCINKAYNDWKNGIL